MSDRCALCDAALGPGFAYDAPPEGETPFPLEAGQRYHRAFLRCPRCGLWVARMDLDLSRLYSGEYVDATYGDAMHATYDRIMGLPEERSDNAARARRVHARFAAPGTLLDVGSGLAVFPARMRALGWRCTALDPDPRAAEHARTVAGVDAVAGDFFEADGLGRFDLVSLNKVLEHVADPVAMLAGTRAFLAEGGRVYVEVPDGERAAAGGPGREEFFLEHLYAFSPASLCLLAARAGFEVAELARLQEPSAKYTLWAFLEPAAIPS
ncbi:class I SAM-dependent methyltransferase [Capillimicrobium parvum]|uniref:Class I SAM-dependent methyltransferase n=1 Tax=Capillimicrobium parvum TaxID=2884022 RepID=A0A9E6Y1Z8_9ACTN|nr:class I SAM-dependent methyltransferase [Capillimicrobium parvum]UGS38717.1 hypothetical protein DSM104329_05147 [Capillimicrobium parvum]